MSYQGFYTKKGAALAVKLNAGAALTITRAALGSGETEESAAALSEEVMTAAVGAPTAEGGTAEVPITLAEAQVDRSFLLTEVGLYAADPDEGEILYQIYRLARPCAVTAGGEDTLCFLPRLTVGSGGISVVCSPAGLLRESDLAPIRQRVMAVSTPQSNVTVAAADLADYLAALPRLVVNDLWITVAAGTCAKRVTLNGFYGPGRIWIQTNGAAVKCTAGLLVNRCGCHVYVTGLTVSGGPVYDRSVVCAYASSHVSLSACTIDGLGATNVTGVISTVGSLMELTGCTVRNTTRYAVESSCASICAVSDAAASGNTVGGNVWRGGVLLLCGSTPQLLGGANNRKAGGLIAAHSGTLL